MCMLIFFARTIAQRLLVTSFNLHHDVLTGRRVVVAAAAVAHLAPGQTLDHALLNPGIRHRMTRRASDLRQQPQLLQRP